MRGSYSPPPLGLALCLVCLFAAFLLNSYFSRSVAREWADLETSLRQADMPDAQVRAISGAVQGLARETGSLVFGVSALMIPFLGMVCFAQINDVYHRLKQREPKTPEK